MAAYAEGSFLPPSWTVLDENTLSVGTPAIFFLPMFPFFEPPVRPFSIFLISWVFESLAVLPQRVATPSRGSCGFNRSPAPPFSFLRSFFFSRSPQNVFALPPPSVSTRALKSFSGSSFVPPTSSSLTFSLVVPAFVHRAPPSLSLKLPVLGLVVLLDVSFYKVGRPFFPSPLPFRASPPTPPFPLSFPLCPNFFLSRRRFVLLCLNKLRLALEDPSSFPVPPFFPLS